MIVEDLWTAEGPTGAELKVLERLARRRQAIEAITPVDDGEVHVLARASATLDDLEECLCEEGAEAPALARGWKVLDQLEARLAERPSAPATVACRPPETCTADRPPRNPEIVPSRRQLLASPPPRAWTANQPKEIHA